MTRFRWVGACALLAALVGIRWAAAQDAAVPTEKPESAQKSQRSGESDYSPAIAEKRIEKILDRRLRAPMAFVETPLNQIMEQIKEEYDIPIVFDTAALEAVASSPDVEVTIDVRNVSLRSALDLMLRQVDSMTYIVDKEVLQITTKEEADQRLQAVVYPVDDLVRVDDGGSPALSGSYDYDSLINILVSSVEHDMWQENGTGEGEVHPYAPGMLVVSQTPRVHTQIQRLLSDMRRVKADIEGRAPAAGVAEVKPITRGIPLKQESVGDSDASRALVRDAIVKSVDWGGDGDEAGDSFLYVLPERVLVRHLPHVVRQVERVMADLGAQPDQNPAGGGMGRGGGGRGGF